MGAFICRATKDTCVLLLIVVFIFVSAAKGIIQNASALNRVFAASVGGISVHQVIKNSPESGLNKSCFDPAGDYANLKECIATKCVGTEDLGVLYELDPASPLSSLELQTVSPGLLHVITQRDSCLSLQDLPHSSPPPASVWGFSFLFVTLINLCSLMGVLLLPCMHLKIYKRVLLFLVALAVGTLAGSGMLVLIPEAFGLTGEDHLRYLWKAATVLGGSYLFFILERVMRIINSRRESWQTSREMKRQNESAMEGTYHTTFQPRAPDSPRSITKNIDRLSNQQELLGNQKQSHSNQAYVKDEEKDKPAKVENGQNGVAKNREGSNGLQRDVTSTSLAEKGRVAPVAYMIIFGDALHNLIDGLSIGAAFTDSTLLGISVSVAVMCEELPHELGDFAVLLNAGMTVRRALLFNFFSSLSCYCGLVIGIVLGENTSANTWIFAIAGGMFLYISLADMLPEMNSAADGEDGKEFGDVNTFVLQNVGLLVGFGIILVLAVYSGDINFEKQ